MMGEFEFQYFDDFVSVFFSCFDLDAFTLTFLKVKVVICADSPTWILGCMYKVRDLISGVVIKQMVIVIITHTSTE